VRNGRLSISRVSGGGEHAHIRIELVDENSGVHFLDASLSMKDFALAITGQGDLPVAFTLRGMELVGKVREHKVVEVEVAAGNWESRELRARAACAMHEVDGWLARWEDALNWHNSIRSSVSHGPSVYRVVYERFVAGTD